MQNPIRVRVKVWVLHPQFEGKVVAEAYAGINHKSKCINDEQDLCKKGQQMISVIRVFYKSTPMMFKKDGRYPKHIAFLDQAEGLPNCPILWGVCYITPIPSMEEITRMMGNVTSVVCGKASSTGTEQDVKGRTNKSLYKKMNPMKTAKRATPYCWRLEARTPKFWARKIRKAIPRYIVLMVDTNRISIMVCKKWILHLIILGYTSLHTWCIFGRSLSARIFKRVWYWPWPWCQPSTCD